jgi:hypothetical protein
MAPKKKKTTSSSPPKKKIATKKSAVKKTLAKKTVKKKTARAKVVKKKAVKKTVKKALVSKEISFSVYTDESLQMPLKHPKKDIIKILSRNPWEAYIFWNLMPVTFQKALDYFQRESSTVGLELALEYHSMDGKIHVQRVSIHPLSQNYYCRFPGAVSNFKATLYAVSGGRSYLLFDTNPIDLPEDKPSEIWDEEWVHPEWVKTGILVRGKDGKYRLAQGHFSSELEGGLIQSDGSSGFMGSSGRVGSSGSSSSRSKL